MLDPAQALAEAEAEARALLDDPFWAPAFAGAKPQAPVLVKNLSHPASDYYLVDFRKNGQSTGRMMVDVERGAASQVTGVEHDGDRLPTFIAPEDVDARLEREIDLADGRRVRLPDEKPARELVWKHSRESRTMFQPLYRLVWSGLTLFLRVDGVYFGQLTPNEPGAPPPH